MFQSEQLQEKWSPLLDYEGLDSISDSHRRAVTACPARKPREVPQRGSSILIRYQPDGNPNMNTNSGANAGFSAGCYRRWSCCWFRPCSDLLIRRAMPNLVAYDLAGVQPMSGPTGLIFAMRSRYEDQSGSETFYDEVDSAFSGQDNGFDLTDGFSDVDAGIGYYLSLVLTLLF